MGKFEDTINNAIKEAKEQLEYAKKTEKKNKEQNILILKHIVLKYCEI